MELYEYKLKAQKLWNAKLKLSANNKSPMALSAHHIDLMTQLTFLHTTLLS